MKWSSIMEIMTITEDNATTKSEISALIYARTPDDFHTFTTLVEKMLDRYSKSKSDISSEPEEEGEGGMIVIKCKSGTPIAACVEGHETAADWRIREIYYKAQGCTVGRQETVTGSDCECAHCKSLVHDYEELIEELIHSR